MNHPIFNVGHPMNVNGTAIKATISRNGIKYIPEELKKFQKQFKNISIQKDHNSSVDASVGLVEKSSFEEKGAKVKFEGFVKEDGTDLLNKIKDNRISKVSIGAIAGKLVREKENDEHLLAVDLTPVELSLVTVPGVVGATISQSLESIELNKTNKKIKIKPVCESFVEEEEEEHKEEKVSNICTCEQVLTEDEVNSIKKYIEKQKELEEQEEVVDESQEPEEPKKSEELVEVETESVEEVEEPEEEGDQPKEPEEVTEPVEENVDIVNQEKNEEDIKMSEEKIKEEDAQAEEPKEEPQAPAEEPKEEPKDESPAEEPKEEPKEEKAPQVDVAELVAKMTESFTAQMKPLQEELVSIKAEQKKASEFKTKNISEEELNAFGNSSYCIEKEGGTFSLWAMTDANGSRMSSMEE